MLLTGKLKFHVSCLPTKWILVSPAEMALTIPTEFFITPYGTVRKNVSSDLHALLADADRPPRMTVNITSQNHSSHVVHLSKEQGPQNSSVLSSDVILRHIPSTKGLQGLGLNWSPPTWRTMRPLDLMNHLTTTHRKDNRQPPPSFPHTAFRDSLTGNLL